jgi:regulator of sigma E protease
MYIMMLLAIVWSEVGIKLAQLLLSLSILVVLHELGHFLPAKWFKCRVDKFYLFFDPWLSLFKKKVGETEYGVGWLPLGGYVKIAGMVDESMDKEQLSQPPQPWEFRSKPAWQRLIIMLGGVTVNILLAFFIYAMILFVWGEKKIPMSSLKNGVWVTDSLMLEVGFKNGDKIIAVDEKPINYFDEVAPKLLTGKVVTIERAGRRQALVPPVNLIEQLVEKKGKRIQLFNERLPALMGNFDVKTDTTNAILAGLQPFDKIIAVDTTSIHFLDEVSAYTSLHKNERVIFHVLRNNMPITLPVRVAENGRTGIPFLSMLQYDSLGVFTIDTYKYGFFDAFPAGVKKTFEKLGSYIDQFKLILNPKTGAYKGVGGFKSMGSIFPATWDWESFWSITAFFSVVLAFMNLLPIPALDGGHVLFTLIEMVSGKKPNEKFLEYAQIVGMILLVGLMLYANGNDWFGWGKG